MKFNKKIKIAIISVIVLVLGYFIFTKIVSTQSSKTQYKTSVAEKGSLITTISASGTITSGSTTYITTGVIGTVNKVYVKNGDTVKKGQKLAEISLDDKASETQTTAYSNYLNALENVKTAQASRTAADVKMWEDRQAVLDAQEEYDNMKSGGWNPDTRAEYTYNEKAIVEKRLQLAKENFSADEMKYNNSAVDISLAKAKLEAALRSYQQVSSTIVAPVSGVLSNLTLAEGVVISDSSTSNITVSTGTDSTTNSQSVTAQKVGAIKDPKGQYQATLTLTEVDVTKIKSGQKVTLTMDAFPDNTFTGTVLAVNTSGSVNSNVTSYTVSVLLDQTDLDIYTNMVVSASIIISAKSDVIMVPSTAVKTSNGTTTVSILKDKVATVVTVEIGDTNDTQTEIKSGINEGDVVITSTINGSSTTKTTTKTSTSTSGSLFGGVGGGMMGGGIPRD
ncbi:MAG TPA: efflux RND transporter periplasmic adaptor subunit [Candidatus Methanoperedens sp.]|nr:efflux RND transporter periplasmic adaptor subunit [Candidatus Methanoperedens sp.]